MSFISWIFPKSRNNPDTREMLCVTWGDLLEDTGGVLCCATYMRCVVPPYKRYALGHYTGILLCHHTRGMLCCATVHTVNRLLKRMREAQAPIQERCFVVAGGHLSF